jgi:hypothetical protein
MRGDAAVFANPMNARLASRLRLRASIGASVATIIMHEPSTSAGQLVAERELAERFADWHAVDWSAPPKFVWTSAPTVYPPSDAGNVATPCRCRP